MKLTASFSQPYLHLFWRIYRRFLPFTKADRLFVVVLLGAILLLTASNTALVWLIGMPFDYLQNGRFDELVMILLILAGVVIFNQALHLFVTVGANWLGLRFVGRVREAVLRSLLFVSFPVASKYHKGDLLARLSTDIDKTQEMTLEVPFFLISHLFTLIFYTVMLFVINWQLAMVALLFTPIFFIQQRLFGPAKRHASNFFYSENGALLTFEEQTLGNMRGISSFGAESNMASLHHSRFENARRWAMKMRWLDAGFQTSLAMLIYLCGIVIVFVGIEHIQAESLGVGTLVSFLIYLGYLSVPVRGFAQAPIQLQGNMGAAERVLEILNVTPLIEETKDAQALKVNKGEIRFNKVSFAYPEADFILRSIDLSIHAGETVALVGPSGSGKSTLARLLMRFYDPQEGIVSIDGMDIRKTSLSSLRKNIAVVWQEPFLINDSIRANLLLARADATEEEMKRACTSSKAWSFIEQLDAALDTAVGSGGVELSTGQRQRLSIAQAILRDAPILIMDEASSALDSQTEQAIAAAMNELRKGRTTLTIAHRYSSIRDAQRVIYFNGDGTIVSGSHEELAAHHSGYREAVEWQTAVRDVDC